MSIHVKSGLTCGVRIGIIRRRRPIIEAINWGCSPNINQKLGLTPC